MTDPTNQAQLDAAAFKAGKDIFDGFGAAANRAIFNETLEAHGKAVPAKDAAQVAADYKKLKDDGTMQRLSTLQLSIIKKHFNAGGNIDFAKFQQAVEFFANGELRGANREMNYLHQWYVWKQFAKEAINRDVDKAAWTNILKSLEKGLEIYEQVYPGGDPATTGQMKLTNSDPKRFKAANQLDAAKKAALRAAIDGLSTDDVLKREKDHLKAVTVGIAVPTRIPSDIQLARFEVKPSELGFFVHVEIDVTDDSSNPVVDTIVDFMASDIGPEVNVDAFSLSGTLLNLHDGRYEVDFFAPALAVGLSFLAIDQASLRGVAAAFDNVPAPATLALFLAGGWALIAAGRRKDGARVLT